MVWPSFFFSAMPAIYWGFQPVATSELIRDSYEAPMPLTFTSECSCSHSLMICGRSYPLVLIEEMPSTAVTARWHAPMWVIIWSPIFIFDFTWLLRAVASSCIWCSSTRFVMQCFGLWTGAAIVIYCFSSSPWIVCGSFVYVLIGTWGWGPLCC